MFRKKDIRIEINDIMDEHCSECTKLDHLDEDFESDERLEICRGCDIGKKLMELSSPLWGDE